MSHQEDKILEKLCNTVFKENLLAYFTMDNAGHILKWNGNCEAIGIQVPEKNSRISDIAVFMEGILPFPGQNMEFSCIKISKDICIDALLFRTNPGYGLIIWDSSKKEALLTRTQQEFNELSLLIEKQKNRITKLTATGMGQPNLFMEDLFLALNFAVLEMNEQGHFVLIGTPPEWIEHIPQSTRIIAGQAYKEDVFSFLGNFISETKERWAKNHLGTFKSGIWIEKDHNDQEMLFEATALDIHHRKLLIISHDVLNPNQTQSIIQKGRDLALHYQDLRKSGRKLKNLHDELEMRVKDRTRDLEKANIRLASELAERKKLEKKSTDVARQLRQSQKMEAIGTLAGGIAHDFNNILAAIIGFTELSLTEAPKNSKLKSRLQKVLNASSRAKDLVSQILMFSHQTDYEKKPLKLKLVVIETLNLLRASLPAFIEIKKDLSSSGYILADHTQIHQVIMNLCTNAWHAMKDNGGTLSVTLTDRHLPKDDPGSPPDLVQGQYLVLKITDTGCGIPADLVERIFDPYFTTKGKDKGTGLGLSVVHGIITKSGGAITVNTTPGKGSTFNIYLPEFFPHTQKKQEPDPLLPGHNERILFVDDEKFQTEMAEDFGKALNYQITAYTDSQKALEAFTRNPGEYDLVITDMIMPKITGKILSQKLLEIRPDIPIILVTGYSEDIDKNAIKNIGVTQYLTKPFSMADLSKTIRDTLP